MKIKNLEINSHKQSGKIIHTIEGVGFNFPYIEERGSTVKVYTEEDCRKMSYLGSAIKVMVEEYINNK